MIRRQPWLRWRPWRAAIRMSMCKKQTLYQQEGKRLISVYPQDLPRLDSLLAAKLRLFGFHPGVDARSNVSEE